MFLVEQLKIILRIDIPIWTNALVSFKHLLTGNAAQLPPDK